MGNIATYSQSIQIPDAVAGPKARAVDTGLGDLADAARSFVVQKLGADQQAQNQDARVKAVTGLEDLTQKYAHDPDYATSLDRYNKDAQALRADIANGLSTPGQQHDFGNEFDLLHKAREVNLKDTVFARERDARVGQLETSLGDFARQAASAQNPIERTAISQMAVKNIQGMAAAGYIGKEEAARRIQAFHADTDEVSALQLIDANPAAAAQHLKDSNFLPGLDPLKRVRLAMSAEEEVKARSREAEARSNEAAAVARSNLSDVMEVMRSGLPVDPALLKGAAGAAAASGKPELVQSVAQAADLAVWQNSARKATPLQLQQELAKISTKAQAEGADTVDATRFTIGRQILSSMNGELARDPLSWAQNQGVATVDPISFQNGASAETMAARASAAHKVAGYYGVSPKFFTDEERSTLKQTLADAPAQSQLAIAASIVKGFGKDAPKALAEISSDAPVFAHLGGLLASGPQYAATVEQGFQGAKAIADKADVVPGGAKLDAAVADVFGTALDERMAGTRQAAIGVAKALYTAEALKRGLTADTFDQDLFEQSLNKAMGQWNAGGDEKGGIAAYNGRDVVLPPFMGQGDLKNTMRGLDDKALAKLSARGGAPVHGDGTPFTAAELRDAYLVTVGPGLYQVSVTDPSKAREFVLDDKSKGYFVLDLSSEARLAASGAHTLTRPEKAQSILDEAKIGTGGFR